MKTVHGTKADARRALKEYRIELERGVKNPEELTVGVHARAWYERRVNPCEYVKAPRPKAKERKGISAVRPDVSVLDLLGF